jgi:hypothetical protein
MVEKRECARVAKEDFVGRASRWISKEGSLNVRVHQGTDQRKLGYETPDYCCRMVGLKGLAGLLFPVSDLGCDLDLDNLKRFLNARRDKRVFLVKRTGEAS